MPRTTNDTPDVTTDSATDSYMSVLFAKSGLDQVTLERPRGTAARSGSGYATNFGAKIRGLRTAIDAGATLVTDDTLRKLGIRPGKAPSSDALEILGAKAHVASPRAVLAALQRVNQMRQAEKLPALYVFIPWNVDENRPDGLGYVDTTASACGLDANGRNGGFMVDTVERYTAAFEAAAAAAADEADAAAAIAEADADTTE
jgi:hypothetical protein